MSARGRIGCCVIATAVVVAGAGVAWARPEYYDFVRTHSGRMINCALCHTHADGPDGGAPGQIGALDQTEMFRLNQARAAFEPGSAVDSPILNDFGDELLRVLGKRKLLEYRRDPAAMADALGMASDLDRDGIPDAREFLDGTHPLFATDGNPWRLFLHNARSNLFHMVMIAVATVFGLWGFARLLHGLHAAARAATHPPSLGGFDE